MGRWAVRWRVVSLSPPANPPGWVAPPPSPAPSHPSCAAVDCAWVNTYGCGYNDGSLGFSCCCIWVPPPPPASPAPPSPPPTPPTMPFPTDLFSSWAIALQAEDGWYLQCSGDGAGPGLNDNERWELRAVTGHHGWVSLRGLNRDRYFTVSDSGSVSCSATSVGDWERFQLLSLGNSTYHLRSHHGTYLELTSERTSSIGPSPGRLALTAQRGSVHLRPEPFGPRYGLRARSRAPLCRTWRPW